VKCEVVGTSKADQLSVNREKMSARNAINARAQNFMMTCSSHPLVFAHCARSVIASRKDSSVCVCF